MRVLHLSALLALATIAAAWPTTAPAHGGDPTITRIGFPVARPGEVWALTDNQGLYAVTAEGTAWLCEDAVQPGAQIVDIATVDPTGDRWLIVTADGLFATADAGCSVRAAPAALADEAVRAVSAHPVRPNEVVVVTETFGAANDAWISVDGGGTWRRAGLALRGRFTQLLRSEGDPDRLYAMHDRGGWTSADGGRTWAPFALGPPELEAQAFAFRLLAAPGGGPGRLFAALEALPDTLVLASDDAGQTWGVVTAVADIELHVAFDRAGARALLISGFDGARRSVDGGQTWVAEPLPVDRLQRIARAPDGDRLWGATGLFFGGPWALGYSDDLGQTWEPVLPRFEDVERRWPCPAAAPSTGCCSTLCPGRPVGADCPDRVPGPDDACAIEPGAPLESLPGLGPDGGIPDRGVPDAGVADGGGLDMGSPDGGGVDDGVTDGGSDQGGAGGADSSWVGDAGWASDTGLDGATPDVSSGAIDAESPHLEGDGHPAGQSRDGGRWASRDADRRGDLLIAPDVEIIPPYPPEQGCAMNTAPTTRGWLALLLAIGAISRRGRRAG